LPQNYDKNKTYVKDSYASYLLFSMKNSKLWWY